MQALSMFNTWKHNMHTIDISNWDNRNLTVREVAKIYGVSVATIWRWAREGSIPKPKKYGIATTRWIGAELKAAIEQAA
jgi:excisionase family DNA binding protein